MRNSQKYLSAYKKETCHSKKHNETEAQRKVEITYINHSYKLT
jgi:hypothetical protein